MKAGVTEEQLRTLHAYRESPAFSPQERLVLEYAEEMCQTPVSISDELFARLREQFTDEQIVELTTAIAIENFRARFNNAIDITPAGFTEGAACALPQRGRGSGGGAHVRVAGRGGLERGGQARATASRASRAIGSGSCRTARTRPGPSPSPAPRRRPASRSSCERARGLGLELERRGLQVVVEGVGVDAVERLARGAELVGARVDARRC